MKMNKNDILCYLHFPNSSWGLRYRATKLDDNPYRNLLKLLANLIDVGDMNSKEAKNIIADFRAGRFEIGLSKIIKKTGFNTEELRKRLVGEFEIQEKVRA